MAAKRFTTAHIAAALRKHDGLIPRAAAQLGTSRQVIHERIQRSAELQTVVREIEDDLKDTAAGNIAKALKKGDMQTTRWFAERKMRDLGFGSKVDGPPPPPPNNERRLTIVKILVQQLEERAAGVHVQVEDGGKRAEGGALGEAMAARKAVAAKPW